MAFCPHVRPLLTDLMQNCEFYKFLVRYYGRCPKITSSPTWSELAAEGQSSSTQPFREISFLGLKGKFVGKTPDAYSPAQPLPAAPGYMTGAALTLCPACTPAQIPRHAVRRSALPMGHSKSGNSMIIIHDSSVTEGWQRRTILYRQKWDGGMEGGASTIPFPVDPHTPL